MTRLIKNEYKWIKLDPDYSLGYLDEHRLFRKHDSHEIAIADNSGRTPSETEDGPLYVVRGSGISVHFSSVTGIRCTVEVIKKGIEQRFFVSCHPWIGRYLSQNFDCKLMYDSSIDKNAKWVISFSVLSNILKSL